MTEADQKQGSDAPWKDESKLRELYHSKGLSQQKIASRLGCSGANVMYWMDKHGIDAREPQQPKLSHASHRIDSSGYEVEYCYEDGKQLQVYIHRLVAVSMYGLDAVSDSHVHHKNGIPWDNRPENLEVTNPSDHAKKHWDRGDLS